MIHCAALLRGINVGGHKPVPMAALREAFAALGCEAVRTYIQSGNVVFRIADGEQQGIAATAERELSRVFGMDIAVVVRTGAELGEIVANQPFGGQNVDEARLGVVFLSDAPSAERAARLDPARSPPDQFVLAAREVFLHCPNGFGRSKLTVDWFERQLGVQAMTRNWRTVLTLAEWTR